jgi:hypothetical protein
MSGDLVAAIKLLNIRPELTRLAVRDVRGNGIELVHALARGAAPSSGTLSNATVSHVIRRLRSTDDGIRGRPLAVFPITVELILKGARATSA